MYTTRILAALAALLLLTLPGYAQEGDAAPAPAGDTGGVTPDAGEAGDAIDVGDGSESEPTSDETDPDTAAGGRSQADPLATGAQRGQAYHRLGPNDYVRIRVAPDNLSFDRAVDAQGNITGLTYLQGPVRAEGLTVSELARELEDQYRRVYISPTVDTLLISIGRIEVAIMLPGGQISPRAVANGTTLRSIVGSVVGSGLNYRRAYLLRSDDPAFYQNLTEAQFVADAPSGDGPRSSAGLPLDAQDALDTSASTPAANGILHGNSINVAGRLRIEQLLATPGVATVEVDVAEFLRGGRLDLYNIPLRHGDVILFTEAPAVQTLQREGGRLVTIVGVPRSGRYNLLPGEGFLQLLEYGGFSESPSYDLRNVLIERRDATGQLQRLVLNIDPVSGGAVDLDTIELRHRDVVRVLSYVQQVFIIGAVNTPGVYSYSPQLKVEDYLAKAGGATLATAHLKFIKVIRKSRDLGVPEVEPEVFNVDLSADYKGRSQEAYEILPGDVIMVPPKGYEPRLSDITGALNTIFLGLNYFERLQDDNTDPNTNPEL